MLFLKALREYPSAALPSCCQFPTILGIPWLVVGTAIPASVLTWHIPVGYACIHFLSSYEDIGY